MFLEIFLICFASTVVTGEVWDMTLNAIPHSDDVTITPRAPLRFFDELPTRIHVGILTTSSQHRIFQCFYFIADRPVLHHLLQRQPGIATV